MNLIRIFENAVKQFSDQTAIKGFGFAFTYSEFDALTHNFAQKLIELGVKPNDIVGLCLDRSAEMMVGIFGIFKAGAAYLPVDAAHPPKRINSILTDAAVKWVVTTSDLENFVSELGFIPVVPDCTVFQKQNKYDLPQITDDTTAYILFTSGSTGMPKGVIIPHSALSNLIEYTQNTYPISQGDVVLLKSPYTFDASIWEIFGWILMGGSLYIAPVGIEKDPSKLSEIIEEEQISFLIFVPSMLQALLSYCDLQHPNFEHLKWVSVGGEVVTPMLVNAFYKIFDYKKTKVINVYGPAEATVYATTYCCKPLTTDQKTPIGFEVTNDKIYILDSELKPVVDGAEGEICIGGAGVGKGYLNRPELTAEKFISNPFTGVGKMYRTGDIGRKNSDGSYDFVGRIDFQVKMRGLRIEIGEIEHALLQLDEIAECVVLMCKDSSDNDTLRAFLRLHTFDETTSKTYYQVSKTAKEHIWQRLKQWLPDFMLPSDYIVYKNFPLTAHEKIDREALLKSDNENPEPSTVSNEILSDTQEKLKVLWTNILGVRDIGLHDDFMEAGGHSLKVVQLITSIMTEFGVEVPMTDFYKGLSIADLAQGIENKQYVVIKNQFTAIKTELNQTVFPLTPEQTELWVLNSMDSSGLTHNIQIEFVLKGNPDIERFKQSVVQVVKNEEMFRSVFELINEQTRQRLLDSVDVEIKEFNLSHLSDNEREIAYENIVKSNGKTLFELGRLPLFSFVLVRWDANEYRLLMAVHHLIFDGWSLYLFMQRMVDSYKNSEIGTPNYRNADYVNYLKLPEVQEKTKLELDYWKAAMKNIPNELTLPKKRNVDPTLIGKNGERHWWIIDAELSSKLEQFALSVRTTPYVIFMSAYQIALGAAANQCDIVVGSPLANRNNELINNLIGYYTNMVCIRGTWNESDSMLQFIEQCNNRVIQAFSNSTISFGEVAKHLSQSAVSPSNSIYSAIFVMQNWPHSNYDLQTFSFSQREIGNNTSKVDIYLNAEKKENLYECWLEYDTELFEAPFTQHLAAAITQALETIVTEPKVEIGILNNALKTHFETVARPTCYVVGEGKLAAHCVGKLVKNGFRVLTVFSVDEWLLSEFGSMAQHGNSLISGNLQLQVVDYIFSINNSIVLNNDFINRAKKLAINYHDAPLPRYAGMYATNWAILNNESVHGISWHIITTKIDAGAILQSEQFEISNQETAFSLNTKCFEAAIRAFEKLVEAIETGTVKPQPQDLTLRTYFGLSSRPTNFGCMTPDNSAPEINRLLRACDFGDYNANEFLLPALFVNNRFYTIKKAIVLKNSYGKVGEITTVDGKLGFYCKDGFVIPEIISSSTGNQIQVEELLQQGETITAPDSQLIDKATTLFSKLAKFESYWKSELQKAEYSTWPFLAGSNGQNEMKLTLTAKLKKIFQNIAPNYEIAETAKAIVALYIMRIADIQTATFGLNIAPFDDENSIFEAGLFSKIVPLNLHFEPDTTVDNALKSILLAFGSAQNAQTFTQNIYHRYPELSEKAKNRPPIIFANEEVNLNNDESIFIIVSSDSIKISTYINSKFSVLSQTIENLEFFIENTLSQPSSLFALLPIAPEQTLLQTIHKLQTPVCSQAEIQNVVTAFEKIVHISPNNLAIYDARNQYSYAAFDRDIRTLAARLKRAGVSSNSVVAVAIDRSYHYFVSIMAVLHQGAAFLTIDNKLPDDRKKYILENADAQIILFADSKMSIETNLPILIVSDELIEIQDFEIDNSIIAADNTAYIIYTSGSSGLPKGVKISNKNLANFISGAISLYEIEPNDKVLQFSTLSFDASIEEIFCSFCSGASLYLRTEEMIDTIELIHFVEKQQISVLDLPTSYWRQLLFSDTLNSENCKSLRLIILGGEALMPADVQRWQTTSPGYNLVNSYGPTETTVVALAHYIYANQHESNSIPIGRPLPGYKPYIVDKQRNIVPFGVAGELHIAGSSVSPGYVDTKNDKAFVWLNVPESEQIRCYCTGDKVYADEHGIIHFVGRTDEQLKIRGYRVEPAEIEAQLNKIAGIENSIVLAQKTDKGEVSLVAFIKFANKNIETQAIKTQLKLSIPAYMIPDSFIPIQSIPLTLNGKIDKRKLLEMSHKYHSEKNEAIDKPTTETEKYLLDLWQKILGVKQIGIHDDFFEIGGHSLKAVALMAELKKDKDLKLPLASLINHSTIYKFAKLVTQEDKPDAWNCLVPIRTEGSKTPLFLIHGAGLNILLYKSLSTYLDPERPIYAFQASGLDGSKPLKSSLNEMATEYIDEMFRVQPSGSYILLGFSLGGFIAYEMSMQLRRLGKVVKFTGLIDSVSYLAHFYNSGFEKLKVDTISFIARPFYLTWLFLKTPKAEKARFFKLKINNFRLCMMYYLTKLRILKQQNIGEELEQLSFLSDNVLIAMNESLKKYQLKAADFPIDLFKAGKATFYIYEPENYGWSKFVTKGITVHTIPSEHSRLFAAPYDRLFAEIIDKRLAEIEAHELVESE